MANFLEGMALMLSIWKITVPAVLFLVVLGGVMALFGASVAAILFTLGSIALLALAVVAVFVLLMSGFRM